MRMEFKADRKAIVVAVDDQGPGSSNCDLMVFDCSPQRTEYTILGINCTSKEFIDCFMLVEQHQGRFDFCSIGDSVLVDIGGSSLSPKAGDILNIDSDEYFTAFLDEKIRIAKRALAFSSQ